jgi:hypothetical protein
MDLARLWGPSVFVGIEQRLNRPIEVCIFFPPPARAPGPEKQVDRFFALAKAPFCDCHHIRRAPFCDCYHIAGLRNFIFFCLYQMRTISSWRKKEGEPPERTPRILKAYAGSVAVIASTLASRSSDCCDGHDSNRLRYAHRCTGGPAPDQAQGPTSCLKAIAIATGRRSRTPLWPSKRERYNGN